MRFTWFNLMPWPDLPDDFREKNRSVWVDIDSRLFEPVRAHGVYNTYMDMLEYAGRLGFDGIGINEHHQNAYGIMPSPNLIAAGLARRTSDVAIVVLGNSIALYNPPVRPSTWLLWFGPALMLAIGAAVLVVVVRRRAASAPAAAPNENEQEW